MNRFIKILHLEDMPQDAELVKRELKKNGINFESLVVDNKFDFLKALKDFSPDVVLSDHNLPTFNSVDAIKIISSEGFKIPVILVTGAMSEEFAVDVMKIGAADYILKDRLQRLPSAVLSAIEKSRLENERKKYLEEVFASEALLKQTENLAHVGSWRIDLEKNVTEWSDETFRILGYKPKEIVPSLESFLNCIHPDDKDNIEKTIAGALLNLSSVKLNFRIRNRNGSVNHIDSRLLIKRNDTNKPVQITGFNQDVTEAKLGEEELKLSRERLRALAAHLQNIREEERTSIAREIHDELGQVLTSLKMNLIYLDKSILKDETIPHKDEFHKEINSMTLVIDDSIKAIRKIITELRPELLENLGLLPALKWQIKEFNKSGEREIDVKILTGDVFVKKEIAIAVYRIFQEALTNISRHSGADKVRVLIEERNSNLILELEDNGIGIDHMKLKETKSFGVLGMRERAFILGGDIKIEDVKPHGTKITLNMPL